MSDKLKDLKEALELIRPYIKKLKASDFPVMELVDLYIYDGKIVYADGNGKLAKIIREENKEKKPYAKNAKLVPLYVVIG